MFTRKLALSVATAALLAASALPAMAAGALYLDFTTVYPNALGGSFTDAQRTLTGRWITNDAGSIIGATNFQLGGVPLTLSTFGGAYTPGTGYNPSTTYTINALNYTFTTPSAYATAGWLSPTTTSYLSYQAAFGPPGSYVGTNGAAVNLGGATIVPTYPHVFTVAAGQLPEIDGGVLPKALFVVAGAFLMLFGRNKSAEA